MVNDNDIFNKIRGGLIVSCQALSDEPLYGSDIMSKMAYAAKLGGASGIRANTPEDISKIKQTVDLPIIGLYKKVYEGSNVYITPTLKEVDELIELEPDIIAIDATNRIRPFGQSLDCFFNEVRRKYPKQLFMADCSCFKDAVHAQEIGFNVVGTTLNGYTEETKDATLPNFDLMKQMVESLKIPVIAEGGIWTPEQLKRAMGIGVHSAVVGTAITRPMEITKRYVSAIKE